MSGPSRVSNPCALIGIEKNPDGSITRDPTRFLRVPATSLLSPQNPVVTRDITVSHSNSTWMRLYVPTAPLNDGGLSSIRLPLVVFYHGGGFVVGSVDFKLYHDFCYLMARELNVIVASPSYRLAPEHRLPAAYEDGVDALEFIRTSDDVWFKSHTDLSNLYLMGTCSGGNMAYNVGLRLAYYADLSPLRICGLILHHPLFGGEQRCESEIRQEHDPVFPPTIGDLWWELCLPVGANRDHEYSCPKVGDGPDNPMRKIQRLGWKVMVCGGGDPMVDRQRDVANLFKGKGVGVVERFTEDGVYGAVELRDPSKSQALCASIGDFISSPPPLEFSIKYIPLKAAKIADHGP